MMGLFYAVQSWTYKLGGGAGEELESGYLVTEVFGYIARHYNYRISYTAKVDFA